MKLNLEVTRDEQKLTENTGSSRFIINGMHDVVIDTAYVEEQKDDSKAISISLVLKKYEDREDSKAPTQTIYNAILARKKDGELNEFGKALLDKLCIVSGVKSSKLNETETKTITRNNKTEKVEAIVELEGRAFTGKFQQEFSKYDNKIIEKIRLITVFNVKNKASAQELLQKENGVEEVEIGKHYNIESSKTIETKYKDKLTKEEVDEYIKNKSKSSDSKSETTSKKSNSSLLDDDDED